MDYHAPVNPPDPEGRRFAAAADANKDHVLDRLRRFLPEEGTPGQVLEIASGTGQHAVHFARALPWIEWRPSDVSAEAVASIEVWRAEAGLANLGAPVLLDVADPAWPESPRAPAGGLDAVVAINLVHISPWETTGGLVAGAARILRSGGVLFLYGPFRVEGETAPSNREFDSGLRATDPRWGVRDVVDVAALAREVGFAHAATIPTPRNNQSLVFRAR